MLTEKKQTDERT